MRDITAKQITLRTATVAGVIFCSESTIALIRSGSLPKGNLFDVARAAGYLGAKLTPQLLPHCHPVNIDGLEFAFSFIGDEDHHEILPAYATERHGIVITATGRSIGRTGIEMETLTSVSVAALEIYDMLKPVDKNLEIGGIRLLDKKGGKSDRQKFLETAPVCAVLVCSDAVSRGDREDKSGKLIIDIIESFNGSVADYKIVPDDKSAIQTCLKDWAGQDIPFIFTTGGTGLGPRDNTVAAVSEIIDRDASAITEAMRNHGQLRTPLAMMSQSVAGVIGESLVITLPGSINGVKESLDAILPAAFHARKMIRGGGH